MYAHSLLLAVASLLGAVEAGVSSSSSSSKRHDGPLYVDTTSGLLHGIVDAATPNVRQFLGVPYADAPVGELRFLAPEPFPIAHHRRGEKKRATISEATAYGPNCVQPAGSNPPSIYEAYMPEFLPTNPGYQSEDCLFLNVYGPKDATVDSGLPVLLFVPGGAFAGGGADVPYTIPDHWIERQQEMIIITINYRVNIFGFPSARDQPVNVGLLDQRLAIEWARDNVKAFGGDASKITLWGQSAGAYSATNYGYAWHEDPIVAGIIAHSGGSGPYITAVDTTHASFSAAALAHGCANLSATEELACMQDVPAEDLLDFVANTPTAVFAPGADGVTVFADNAIRAADGRVAQVPSIIGSNSREGTAFATTWDEESVDETEVAFMTTVIRCVALAEVANRLGGGLPTYQYYYTGNFSNITPLPWIGAAHTVELPLITGQHDQFRGDSTDLEKDVSVAMQELWLSFAKDVTQDPTSSSSSFTWPEFAITGDTVAVFAEDGQAVQLKDYAEVAPVCVF